MNKSYLRHITGLLSVMALTILGGCSSEEQLSPLEGNGIPVRVGAAFSTELMSRAYQPSGEVVNGYYYLTYPSTNNTNQVATVNFSTPEYGGTGIGIVTAPSGQELEWSMVGNGANPTLYLDNVIGNDGITAENSTTVTFTDSYNPFKAAVFDSYNGSNDLLWGSVQASRGSARVDFDLNHNMARIRVIVTADKTNAVYGDEVDLSSGSTLTLSSVAQTPVSFNRLDGSLDLGETPVYSTLTLVDNTQPGTGINWSSAVQDSSNPNLTDYTTQDFVIPPQVLLEDNQRPMLTITTLGGKTFSGILPHAMEVIYPDQENPYPVALAFLKSHILTIQTTITQDPPELVFMPVQVVEWVDKGDFVLEGHQAGVYRPNEFLDLIQFYQEGNSTQLLKYGYLTTPDDSDEEIWVFNFFRDVTLDFDAIYGKMKPLDYDMPNFQFSLLYNVTVVNTDGTTRSVNAQQLYDIVTGNYTWN